MGQYLTFLVATVLDKRLPRRLGHHRRLVRTLAGADELRNVVFVSTNYDILIHNALTDEPGRGFDLDYGIEFRNFDPSLWATTTGVAPISTTACSSTSRTAR